MKTVGIIGGLSPESTILYYQGINQGVRARLGGHHAGRVLIDSLDFGEFYDSGGGGTPHFQQFPPKEIS